MRKIVIGVIVVFCLIIYFTSSINTTLAAKSTRDVELNSLDNLYPVVDKDVVNSIRSKLSKINEKQFPGEYYSISSYRNIDNWALVYIQSYDDEDNYMEGRLFIGKSNKSKWTWVIEGERVYGNMLNNIPSNIINPISKARILKSTRLELDKVQLSSSTVSYKFPWEKDLAWSLWRPTAPWHGWHCNNTDTQCALDFGTSGSNKKVLAASDGTVTVMCSEQSSDTLTVNIRITDDDGLTTEYFHIKKPTLAVQTGNSVSQGDYLGQTWTGDLSDDCEGAGADQGDNQGHLHWVLPRTKMVIDGWTFDYPDKCFTHLDGTTKCAKDGISFVSSNDGTCSPPTEGTWTVDSECVITGPMNPPGDVILTNQATMNIHGLASIDIKFESGSKLVIESGSRVLLENGAKIF